MKPPSKLSLSDRQVRAKLAQLKKIGLYRGNNLKAHPTDYGRRTLKKYMDVLEGKAAVVTVPRVHAKEFRESHRVTRNKIVVPKERKDETVRFSKKDKALYSYRRDSEGGQYRREIIPNRLGNTESLPALKKGQVYSIPFNRGRGRYEFLNVTTKEELNALINQYEQQGKYKNIAKFVRIQTYRAPRKRAA